MKNCVAIISALVIVLGLGSVQAEQFFEETDVFFKVGGEVTLDTVALKKTASFTGKNKVYNP